MDILNAYQEQFHLKIREAKPASGLMVANPFLFPSIFVPLLYLQDNYIYILSY